MGEVRKQGELRLNTVSLVAVVVEGDKEWVEWNLGSWFVLLAGDWQRTCGFWWLVVSRSTRELVVVNERGWVVC